jgi:hypothetical protein
LLELAVGDLRAPFIALGTRLELGGDLEDVIVFDTQAAQRARGRHDLVEVRTPRPTTLPHLSHQ